MDLLRSTIAAAFYHFPIASLAEMLTGNEDALLPIVSEIVKWERSEFSLTEVGILANIMESEWMVDEAKHFEAGKYSQLSRVFLMLNQFAERVLSIAQSQTPRVRFDQLLRWRETSLLVGEDLFATAFVAEEDLKRGPRRTEFVWPDILDHDNFKLNAIIDQELSDTHSHINAATAVFDFNWISLMNYPSLANIEHTRKKGFLKDGAMQSYDLVCRHSRYNDLTLTQWIQIAAAIRLQLFYAMSEEYGAGQEEVSFKKFSDVLKDQLSFVQQVEKTTYRINMARCTAMKTSNGHVFDYAIQQRKALDISRAALTSPYMIHFGERKLLYDFFYNYFGNSHRMREWAPWVYLYVLIKNKVRREFIQTNQLVGFDNFDGYQKSKSQFLPHFKQFEEIAYSYAVQTALGPDQNYYLEARMTPNDIRRLRQLDCTKSIFGNEVIIPQEKQARLTFVAHFIKSKDKTPKIGMPRHGQTLQQLWKQVNLILKEKKSSREDAYPQLVGIDAASSEFNCRPEVMAPIFRYARFRGLQNQTFHAGEDFYDLLDGLRTIDETIFYMRFTLGCRIGHGLALGTPAEKFYESRHNTVIIPRQILLDNLVWFKYRAQEFNITLSAEVQLLIEKTYMQLLSLLHYPICDMYTYWQGMRHRGDLHEQISGWPDEVKYTLPEESHDVSGAVEQCLVHYLYSSECKEEGDKAITLKLPASFPVDVQQLQDRMRDRIGRMGIVIECNPSSNRKIGRFSRYDEHPIFNFHSVDGISRSALCVSINTDDRGVLATSLRNEFSLIGVAMHKQMDACGRRLWTDVQIEEYIKRIAHYGNLSRFTIDKGTD